MTEHLDHRGEAQRYVDRYFERYPGVRRYMDETRNQARELGYVTNSAARAPKEKLARPPGAGGGVGVLAGRLPAFGATGAGPIQTSTTVATPAANC